MKVSVVHPEGRDEYESDLVVARLADGDIGIQNGHANLIGYVTGRVRFNDVEIDAYLLRVHGGNVEVLA